MKADIRHLLDPTLPPNHEHCETLETVDNPASQNSPAVHQQDKKTGCWFVDGDDLTGALHDL